MTATIAAQPDAHRMNGSARLAGPCLVLAGLTFLAGGITHPSESGPGSKVQQLHDMLVDPAWYPSHAFLLASMALFTAGAIVLRRSALPPGMARLLHVVSMIAVVATVAMVVHLLAALGAGTLADGEPSIVSRLQTVNETLFAATWGVAVAALAIAGGITGTVGNRMTIPFGALGGLSYALASATIAYTDRFDSLFKASSLLAVWAVSVGVIAWRASGVTSPGGRSVSTFGAPSS